MGKKPISKLAIASTILGFLALICAIPIVLVVYYPIIFSVHWFDRTFWFSTIGSIFLIFSYLILGVVAFILGLKARIRIIKSNGEKAGKGFAIFAIVVGVVLLLFWVITTFKFLGMMMQY
jgi:hypothetical protein